MVPLRTQDAAADAAAAAGKAPLAPTASRGTRAKDISKVMGIKK
jgi:hypothetical protein